MNNDVSLIKGKIKLYIVQSVYVDSSIIKDDSLLFKEGYFNSIGFMKLITFLEEEFGIKIVDSDMFEENFKSIDSITDFVIRKQS
jgi:acyl carrier protein